MLLAPENKISFSSKIPTPKEYEAYLYLIKIWKTETFVKKYVGSRVGNFDPNNPTYLHSSDTIEMRKDFSSLKYKGSSDPYSLIIKSLGIILIY